jgi:hypothetical protein
VSSINHTFLLYYGEFYVVSRFNTTFSLCSFILSEDIFAFGEFYAVSRGEAQSLKNLGKIETVILDCWAAYLNMIERNQDVALPNKDLKAFLFTTQHCVSGSHLF